MHPSQKGKHYGELSAKYLEVFRVLLFEFHNARSGACFPSYERIMEKAHCARQTVADALSALERVGLLEIWNRLLRVRWFDPEAGLARTRVVRTSNAYAFAQEAGQAPTARPETSKSKLQTRTENQVSNPSLDDALNRLLKGVMSPSGPIKRASGA